MWLCDGLCSFPPVSSRLLSFVSSFYHLGSLTPTDAEFAKIKHDTLLAVSFFSLSKKLKIMGTLVRRRREGCQNDFNVNHLRAI